MTDRDRLYEIAQNIADHGMNVDNFYELCEIAEEKSPTPAPQIIRTVKELEALDPDTVFMNGWGDLFDVSNVQAGINTEDSPYYFPCSVVATGAQARAAREAMEEESE